MVTGSAVITPTRVKGNKMQGIRPEKLIAKHYNGNRNFMTPYWMRAESLPDGALELTHGPNPRGGTNYGVTVVRVDENGDTYTDRDASGMFHSLKEAEDHIKKVMSK